MHLPLTFFTEYTLTVDRIESLVASTQAVDSDDCGCSYDTQVGTADDYLQVDEETGEAVTKRWKGIIGVEGELTGDGRFIQPEALRWENLPIPLRYVSADVGAHSGAVVVGRIDKIERGEAMEDGKVPIFAEGDFDMESEVGREAARQVEGNLMCGVSMDLDDVAFEVRIAADAPALMPVDPQALVKEGKPDEDGRVKVQEMSPDDEVMVTTGARVRAATIVAVPAFATAQIGMADAVDEVFKDAEEQGEEQSFADLGTVKVKIAGSTFEVDISEEEFNWVEDVGGLPAYIREIADALKRKGWKDSRAIPTAVNVTKKMCATGDLNFPGDQDVNPGSRAKACKAVAEWEEKKARAKADSAETEGLSLELDAATEDAEEAAVEWDAEKIVADLRAKEAEGDLDLDDLSDEQIVIYVVDIYGVSEEVAGEVVAALVEEDDEDEDEADLLVAAALPLDHEAPPAAHFSNPNFTEPTPLTVTEDGRVMGHMAIWGTCHLTHTNRGKCVTPPHSKSGYAYFATGAVLTKEGAEIPVGQITLGTGHAAEALNAKQTLAHYDNSGKAVADITVGEDQFGIWFSGSLRPGVTAKQVRTLRAHPLSGDWRRMAGNLELVATLCVNVQGFPVPRPKGRVTSGVMQSLVAAGMLPPRKVRRPGTRGALSMDDLRYLKRLADRERREEQESRLQVLSNADALAQRLRSQKREATLASARKIAAQQMAARVRGL